MNQSRKSLTWISLALAVAIAGVILVKFTLRSPSVVREVPLSDLVRRDGRLYWQQETIPFTGIMTENYPDGSRKSRSILFNGVLHGVSEGWYTNGVLQVREHFRDGVSHGLREKWFVSGVKLSEASIDAGKIEGVFSRWHENGNLAEEVQMKNGNPDGLSMAYHQDGTLKARAKLENGKVIEIWQSGDRSETHISKTSAPAAAPAL